MKRYLFQQHDRGIKEILNIRPYSDKSELDWALEQESSDFINDNEQKFDIENLESGIEVICQEIDINDKPIGPSIEIKVYGIEHRELVFYSNIIKEY